MRTRESPPARPPSSRRLLSVSGRASDLGTDLFPSSPQMLRLRFGQGGAAFLALRRPLRCPAAWQSTRRVEYKPIKKVMVANRGERLGGALADRFAGEPLPRQLLTGSGAASHWLSLPGCPCCCCGGSPHV